jgi:hypothetical protein
MDDLRTRLDERASSFRASPDAHGKVLARVAKRRMRRRVTSGVIAVAVATAALGGLWSVTRQAAEPLQSITPTPMPPPSPPVADLRIALDAKVNGWIPLDDGHVLVAGPGTLSRVDRVTGRAHVVSQGSWDYDYTELEAYGEGTVLLASGSTLWEIGGRGCCIARRFDLGLGSISAVLEAHGRTWVAATGADGGVLAEIDLEDGHAIQTFPVGQGVYQLAAMHGYLFVGTQAPNGPAVLRLDVSTGTMEPVPDAEGMAIAVTGSTLWWAYANRIHCTDGRLLTPCGDVDIRAPVALAGDGGHLWVLSATGSTRDNIYEPDPNQPAQLTELDGTTGEIIAGPIALPDTTPARLAVFHGRAWVGFHDTGRLVMVKRCPLSGCDIDLRRPLKRRLVRLVASAASAQAELGRLQELQDSYLALSTASPSVRTTARIQRIEREIQRTKRVIAYFQRRAEHVQERLSAL